VVIANLKRLACLGAAVAAAGLTSTASAQILFQQAPDLVNGFGYYSDAAPAQFYDQYIADDFTFGSAQTVYTVRFWGCSEFFIFPDYSNMASFTVEIWPDAGGVPGAVPIYTESFLPAATNPVNIGTGAFGQNIYQQDVTLAVPQALAAGTYWLSVGSVLIAPGDDAWVWISVATNTNSFIGAQLPYGGAWAAFAGLVPGDQGFELRNPNILNGACSQPNGDCSIQEEAPCLAGGGTYAGNGTTCPPPGACCVGGACVQLNPAQCTFQSGTVIGGACFACTCEPLPPNDECAMATAMPPLSGGLSTISGTNCGATGATNSSCAFGGGPDNFDIWFSISLPAGQYAADTEGSVLGDTTLVAFDGCAGAELACDDDAGSGLLSRITFTLAAPTTVVFRVAGWGNGAGPVTLNVAEFVPPANDDCSTAPLLPVPGNASGNTTAATFNPANEGGGCNFSPTNTAPAVWYRIVGTGNTVTASLCGSGYDCMINVYCGASGCGALNCITGNDDFCGLQSQVSFCTEAGAPFYIVIGGFGGGSGAFTLNVSDDGVPCTPTIASPPPAPARPLTAPAPSRPPRPAPAPAAPTAATTPPARPPAVAALGPSAPSAMRRTAPLLAAPTAATAPTAAAPAARTSPTPPRPPSPMRARLRAPR
jgi:hypothetical protein